LKEILINHKIKKPGFGLSGDFEFREIGDACNRSPGFFLNFIINLQLFIKKKIEIIIWSRAESIWSSFGFMRNDN